jgi:hypothetical protein
MLIAGTPLKGSVVGGREFRLPSDVRMLRLSSDAADLKGQRISGFASLG